MRNDYRQNWENGTYSLCPRGDPGFPPSDFLHGQMDGLDGWADGWMEEWLDSQIMTLKNGIILELGDRITILFVLMSQLTRLKR